MIFVGFLFELSYDLQHSLAIQTDEVNQGLGAEEWEVMAMCLQCPGATVRDRLRPHEFALRPTSSTPPEKVSCFLGNINK